MRRSTLCLCLVLAGCASSSTDNPFQSGRARPGQVGPVQVVVANNAFLDMHVYVMYSGGLTRSLGLVTGLSTRTLEIPEQVIQTLDRIRLIADPIGSTERHISDSLLAYPGTRIHYTIQNLLSLSVAWIETYAGDEESDEESEDEEDGDPENEEEDAEQPEAQQTPDDSPNN